MKKLRVWKWADPVYDVSVVLLKGDGDQALAWLDRTFADVTDVGTFTGAKTLWIARERGCALALWFPTWFDPIDGAHLSVLAHESFHAAEFVMRERGMSLTDASDEAYAYYIAWMFRECHKRMSK